MYGCTRELEDSVYHNTAPHEQPRGLEYKSRCKNSWARFSPRAPHVKRAAWVLIREEGITPQTFVLMAFSGTTCCPFWLPRGCMNRDARISLSEDKTVYCTKLLLERAERDGETIRWAAHRSRAQAWSSSWPSAPIARSTIYYGWPFVGDHVSVLLYVFIIALIF